VFSINGIALENEALEWVVRGGSSVVSSVEYDRQSLSVPGRAGVTPLIGSERAPVIPIQVETPRSNQGALRSLFQRAGLVLTEDGQDGIQAEVELMGLSPVTYGPADEVVEIVAMLRIPGVYWRDTATGTSDPVAIGSASVGVEVLEGLSAPVTDAIVRVKGGVTGLRVTDSGGSFFEYEEVLASGDYLRFHSDTGRAFVTSSDTWTGGTEVTGHIENGPGPYYLEMVPWFTDPADRVASLLVTSSARTGSPTIEVRGRRAHAV